MSDVSTSLNEPAGGEEPRFAVETPWSLDHGDVVKRLHAAALDELERRGTDPAVMTWLRTAGETAFPKEAKFFENWPPPKGYRPYFNRLYRE